MQPHKHSAFFSPAKLHRIHALSPAIISRCIPQCALFCFFLTLLSALPFVSAVCSTSNTLWPTTLALVFVHSNHSLTFIVAFRSQFLCICTAPLQSFLNGVVDRILSGFPKSTAQMLLHCRACCLAYNHLHILRVVTEFFTANSLRLRVAALFWSGISSPVGLTQRLFTLCRLLVGECSSSCALNLSSFLAPISYRGHLTALISAFQHSSRISISAYFELQHSLSPCDRFKYH